MFATSNHGLRAVICGMPRWLDALELVDLDLG